MKILKRLRRLYVRTHARLTPLTPLPSFSPSEPCRRRLVFSGKVQKVGFRQELKILALRMKLTGWVRNREDGRVEAEVQGSEEKIRLLAAAMSALKRASVHEVEAEELPLLAEEEGFYIIP